ncbi:putative c6 transcription factor [Phaeomoniella chlamydospora]|uniref:Putative c6 transcription factor n=1 Tax=Phaeomoniella chlamydospora TaxID=158046 RepID=A0A0G2G2A2_PHACM|nr:putative c6 transcription factor [Phaeomoniella chlamydospora]
MKKLRCDVVQDPFTTCSRCRRLNLDCKIENNFKRIGKRSRNAEMEREIVALRKQIAEQQARLGQIEPQAKSNGLQTNAGTYNQGLTQAQLDQWGGSHEAVASLLDLRSGLDAAADANFSLPSSIQNPLLVEQFADKVTNALYSNRNMPLGLCKDSERVHLVKFLARDFEELEDKLSSDSSAITNIYLRTAAMHLRLGVFFSSSNLAGYNEDLLALYLATTSFVEACLNLDQPTTTLSTGGGTAEMGSISLLYGTNYIFQMMLAAGFVLFKLKNSQFAQQGFIDLDYTKNIFLKTIWAIRNISATPNDLPERLAEVLAQLWKHGGVSPGGQASVNQNRGQGNDGDADEDLQLKVKCRNSMSLVYDAVWRWREDFMSRGNSFDTFLKNPTDPATATDSSASSVSTGAVNSLPDASLPGGMSTNPMVAGMAGMATGLGNLPLAMGGMGFGDVNANYEVFDPLNWMLDGLVDFPYSSIAMQGLDPSTGGGAMGL